MSETGKMTATRNERVTLPRRAFLRGMTGAALTLGTGVAASAQGPFSYVGKANPTGQGTNPGANPAANPGMYFGPETVQVSLADGSASPIYLGRGYVVIGATGQPVEAGYLLYDHALDAIPPSAYNLPTVFRADMPAEAGATLYRQIGLSKWTGHDPRGIGEVPHFHAVFLYQPVQPPSPNLQVELTPVSPQEVPPGFLDGRIVPTAVVPGVGDGYENPSFPHMNPHWYGATYNLFYYGGHLNGMGTGATNDFLATTQSQTMSILQPAVYPKPGLYPYRLTITHDATLGGHRIILDDFRPATHVVGG